MPFNRHPCFMLNFVALRITKFKWEVRQESQRQNKKCLSVRLVNLSRVEDDYTSNSLDCGLPV